MIKKKGGHPKIYRGKMVDFHTRLPKSHLMKLKKLSKGSRSRTFWLTQMIDREYEKEFSQ